MADRFYWLKLKRDFFKRHDIRIIESMQNGKDYILFYLKLLCESVDHEGNLRFNDQIPYNEEMLATVTNTNIDIVRSAIQMFSKLGMMEIMDDGTYFMNEVNKMIGTSIQDDHTRESTRLRVQAYRERKKQEALQNCYGNVTCNGEIELEKEKELDIEIDNKEKDKKETSGEVTHTYGEYKRIRLKDSQYKKLVDEFGENKTQLAITKLDEYVQSNNNKNKYKDFYLVLRKVIKEDWFHISKDIQSVSNDELEELIKIGREYPREERYEILRWKCSDENLLQKALQILDNEIVWEEA